MNSEPLSKSSDTEIDSKGQSKPIHELNGKMIEFRTMNAGKFDKIEHLNCKMTALEKDFADLKEILEDESIRALKAEMRENSQIQKDYIKCYHSIKNEISEVKEQLYMVYGREFFNRRK